MAQGTRNMATRDAGEQLHQERPADLGDWQANAKDTGDCAALVDGDLVREDSDLGPRAGR